MKFEILREQLFKAFSLSTEREVMELMKAAYDSIVEHQEKEKERTQRYRTEEYKAKAHVHPAGMSGTCIACGNSLNDTESVVDAKMMIENVDASIAKMRAMLDSPAIKKYDAEIVDALGKPPMFKPSIGKKIVEKVEPVLVEPMTQIEDDVPPEAYEGVDDDLS